MAVAMTTSDNVNARSFHCVAKKIFIDFHGERSLATLMPLLLSESEWPYFSSRSALFKTRKAFAIAKLVRG
jgi:hypothetical protein